jgi:hypothetical protein
MLNCTLLERRGDGARGSLCKFISFDGGHGRPLADTMERIVNGLVTIGLTLTYFPKAHPRTQGLSKSQIIRNIDYVGGVLSIVGVTLL